MIRERNKGTFLYHRDKAKKDNTYALVPLLHRENMFSQWGYFKTRFVDIEKIR